MNTLHWSQPNTHNPFPTIKAQMPLHHGFSFKTFATQKKSLLVVSFVIVVYYIINYTQGLRSLITSHSQHLGSTHEWYDPTTGSDGSLPLHPKYAYASLMTNTTNSTQDYHYREALRILIWQLKIAPETRSPANLPIVVLCTDNVAETYQEQLKVWGADLVVVVEREKLPWQKVGQPRWQDVLTKVRFHDFTQFDKLLFLDADTILTKPLDDVFLEPEAEEQVTRQDQSRNRPTDAAQPARYVFAAIHDNEEFHHWPPVSYANGDYWFSDDYLNAGFYIIKPDPVMLKYYRSLMITQGRFPPSMPEQGLFNYAHRQKGNMPWMMLNYTWNTRVPMVKDLEGVVRASMKSGGPRLTRNWPHGLITSAIKRCNTMANFLRTTLPPPGEMANGARGTRGKIMKLLAMRAQDGDEAYWLGCPDDLDSDTCNISEGRKYAKDLPIK